jgi:hypothetical protein
MITAAIDEMEGLEEQAGAADREKDEAGRREAEQEQQREELGMLRQRAHAEAARREHWCMTCGKTFMLTPTEILQHRRSHVTGA